MVILTRGERFKDARTVYNQHGKQTMHEVYLCTNVGASTIKELEDDESSREVGGLKIATLAKHYGVSIDWLLGLSEVRSLDTGVQAVSKFTGLSQEAVEMLSAWPYFSIALNALFEDSQVHNVFSNIAAALSIAERDSPFWPPVCGEDAYIEAAGVVEDAGAIVLPGLKAARYLIAAAASEVEDILLARMRAAAEDQREG